MGFLKDFDEIIKELTELNITIIEVNDKNTRFIKIDTPSECINDAIYLDIAETLMTFLIRDSFHYRIMLDIDYDYYNELIEYLRIFDPNECFIKRMILKDIKKTKMRESEVWICNESLDYELITNTQKRSR